ncbi:O-antigen ligase family protein [Sphingopyxis sp. MWB1]|uniref:O-antigen ligase family protein n=1 Tax=Sphingopyxis sp. MWB1 TaxID=1537715 RepID=UPI001362D41B|nr:O-antigen ligase family protein [Sphingopyxis sp. MWB1]
MITLILLGAAFLMVGSGRDDIVSLLIWRPLSAVLLCLAAVTCGGEAWRRGKSLLLFAMAVVLLLLLHVIPLPPAIWATLPGREIVADVYRAAGMQLPWQPLSMAQARTWNALFSLAGPVAVLLAALALEARQHRQLLYVILGIGLFSGVIGMIQAIGPSHGALYFYRITNNGLGVGLFANRNHHAAFLATLYPILAANLSLFKGKPDTLFFHRAMTLTAGCLLLAFILMTGSRAGILLAVFGLAFAWWVYRAPTAQGRVVGTRGRHRSRLVGLGVAVLLLVIGVIVVTQTPALSRLLETDPSSELRVRAFPVVADAIGNFFPFGSGFGTFVEVYQIHEPDKLVTTSYFNHAHNDFAEWLLTGGVPALLLLLWAGMMASAALLVLHRRRGAISSDPDYSTQILGRSGFAVIVMLALASLTDYPLRVPSLLLYTTIAAVWCANAYRFNRK